MHDALRDLPDKRHFYRESRFQHIVLASYAGHLGLILDGFIEVHSFDEHRIHECLAVVPMLFRPVGAAGSVLVAGGGDGLAARRLLGFHDVERVVICEQDDEITALARREPLRSLNDNSLASGRVEVVRASIQDHVEETEDLYDLIICDLPAPRFQPHGALYTPSFFRALAARLRPGGAIAARVPFVPQTFALARSALAEAMACVYPYRCTAQSIGTAGFLLASAEPIARRRGVPGWCGYLNERVVPTLFSLAKDELHFISKPEHTDAVAAWRVDHSLPPGEEEEDPSDDHDEFGGDASTETNIDEGAPAITGAPPAGNEDARHDGELDEWDEEWNDVHGDDTGARDRDNLPGGRADD
jgi:predicted membrane-bound spermidine synthase